MYLCCIIFGFVHLEFTTESMEVFAMLSELQTDFLGHLARALALERAFDRMRRFFPELSPLPVPRSLLQMAEGCVFGESPGSSLLHIAMIEEFEVVAPVIFSNAGRFLDIIDLAAFKRANQVTEQEAARADAGEISSLLEKAEEVLSFLGARAPLF